MSGLPQLWPFALALYRQPGISTHCLGLQQCWSVDVNLLLAGCWLAAGGRIWSRADVDACHATWQSWRGECILPLRAVRRYLKQRDAALYEQTLALELEAERRQLEGLELQLGGMGRYLPGPLEERLQGNVRTVLGGYGVPPGEIQASARQLFRGMEGAALVPRE